MSIIPQLIYVGLTMLGIGFALARYGQVKKTDTYDIVDLLIGPAASVGLLWWGGFFNPLIAVFSHG